MTGPVSSDRGRGLDGEDDEDRDPKRVRTASPDDQSSDYSSSESDTSDDESDTGPAAPPSLESWVGQCYDNGFTAQQILDTARQNLGDHVADNDMALHNVRLAAALETEQPQVGSGEPVITVEIVGSGEQDEAVEWEVVQPGTPQPGTPESGVQYAPVAYEDWAQIAQQDNSAVFAGSVTNPYDVFSQVDPIPSDTCAICMEQLSGVVVQSTVCHHYLDKDCLDEMILGNAVWRCPTCRAKWS